MKSQNKGKRGKAQPRSASSSSSSKGHPPRKKKESFIDLLNQDVSWTAVKKVLTYEIPSPFSTGKAELGDVAAGEGKLSGKDLEQIQKKKHLLGDSFGNMLVERGIITHAQLEEAQLFREKTQQPLWRTLLHLRMIEPQQLVKLLLIELPFGEFPETQLTQWFIQNKVVSKKTLKQAWKEAAEREVPFLEHLRRQGLARDDQIAQALAAHLNLPYDDLAKVKEINHEALERLPYHFPYRYHALPYKWENNTLSVAFADSEHLIEMENLGLLLDFDIQPVIVPKEQLDRLLGIYAPQVNRDLKEEEITQFEIQDEIRDKPAPELLNVILRGIIRADGSDIHIEPQKGFYRIRYRIDGVLHDVLTLQRDPARKVVNQVKALAEMDTANPYLPQDGHLIAHLDGRDANLRVSTLPTPDGEKIVLRVVKTHFAFSRFEQLGMNVKQRQLMNEILNLPSGLILAAGPVGSGKTTTIYSCLNCLNPLSQNIMTIEDPVEYKLAGVTQAQVNPKVQLTFAAGLRAILRQDPDIIMVGEIRDDDTANIAVTAALTGQQVFSTIHANSATNAYTSLQLLGVRPNLLGYALAGIIFQKIVRKNCANCSQPVPADQALKKELGLPPNKQFTVHEGMHCPKCFHTGYSGRTGAFEILMPNDAFRKALSTDPAQENLNKAAVKSGMVPLRNHALELLRSGVTSPAEVRRIL